MKLKEFGPLGGARPKFYYVDPPLEYYGGLLPVTRDQLTNSSLNSLLTKATTFYIVVVFKIMKKLDCFLDNTYNFRAYFRCSCTKKLTLKDHYAI